MGDVGLTLPLDGVRLVEASAGTGKTFVLATLYARAVVERQLPVDALLAVTFTEAATKELRTRIRGRLALAARLAAGEPHDPADPAQVSTHALVAWALAAGEAPAALAARLRVAAESMDLAPVFTIHGFCRRVLADHALEAGVAPGEVELVANERALREEVATDLWRALCSDADDARTLVSLWKSPVALAKGLDELWSVDALRPDAADAPDAERAARAVLDAATATLVDACARLGDDGCAAMFAAIDAGALHAGTYRRDRIEGIHAQLRAWVDGDCAGDPPDHLDALGDGRLKKSLKKGHEDRVVCDAISAAIDAWLVAAAAHAATTATRAVALAHRVRDDGRRRLAALKAQRRLQGFDDLIRGVADALAGPGGDALAARLRAQYRFAFVDEFQDTDPRQWAIFRTVFAEAPDDGGPRALFLIGDPKQAIYRFRGGDVHTYLEAKATAAGTTALAVNHRSRPRMLAAVQALYAAVRTPFGEPGIEFEPVAPGGAVHDDALRIDGAVAPALEVLTWDDADGAPAAGAARERAAVACAARIRELLEPGRTSVGGDPLAPGDIAVLVATHREARTVQRQLQRAGVPSVTAGRDSLYDSDEAADLLVVLDAALHLADDRRLRAALATPLVGVCASGIAALDGDDGLHRKWQDRALAWRQRWERHGPLALVGDLCAAAAPRLLALDGGERRLANWLQLGEALQAETAGREPVDVARHLATRIAEADDRIDEDLLRLESDAARVRIATLHASKGLEFPVVFLPFLAHAGGDGGSACVHRHHDVGAGRVGHLRGDDADAKHAKEREKAEGDAEKLRLLYVGLTRARLATIVGFGPLKRDGGRSAFARLLSGGEAPAKADGATLRARLDALAVVAPDAIVVRSGATTLPPGAPPAPTPVALPPAATPRRPLSRDWGVHSFSALAREAGGAGEARRAGDEHEPVLPAERFAGSRFGNVLHEALETVDFAAWRDARGDVPPPGQAAVLERALRSGGYGSDADLADGLPRLAALVRATLNAPLPEGVRLADLPPHARIAELEFHFALAPAEATALLSLLHAHGFVSGRSGFGARARLEGLLTGFVDLVYEHAGRFFVLDYKSNLLPAYDDAALADAMAHGEYDLQYLLYVLALHRWLRFRKPDYDYDRDVGGVRYLFSRGLDGGGGIVATKPPRALVDALDTLLTRAEAAA